MTTPRSPIEIGAWLRRRRIELDLNQDELPGVSPATVRKIEKGTEPNPRDRTKLALARALDLEPDAYDRLARGEWPEIHSDLTPEEKAQIDAEHDEDMRMVVSSFTQRQRDEYLRLLRWVRSLPAAQRQDVFSYGDYQRQITRRRMEITAERRRREAVEAQMHEAAQFAQAADGGTTEDVGPAQRRPSPPPEPEDP